MNGATGVSAFKNQLINFKCMHCRLLAPLMFCLLCSSLHEAQSSAALAPVLYIFILLAGENPARVCQWLIFLGAATGRFALSW